MVRRRRVQQAGGGGEIIDGHNRAMIADSLGIDYPSEVRTGLNEAQKRLLAVDLNLARRQLNDAQKATLGRTIEPDVAAEASRRQVELGKSQGSPTPLGTNVHKGTSRDDVAKKVGMGSGRTYERAKQVLEAVEAQPDGADMIKHVKDGSLDLKAAKKELKQRGVEWDPVRRLHHAAARLAVRRTRTLTISSAPAPSTMETRP